jgi:hypothetical protein
LSGYGLVDTYAADADAKSGANVTVVTPALVAVRLPRSHPIEDPHHPAASTTSYKAAQQRAATPRRFARHSLLHMRILGNHPLVFLELIPGDIAWMVIFQ